MPPAVFNTEYLTRTIEIREVRAHVDLKTDAGYQRVDVLDEPFVASALLPSPKLVLTPMLNR